MLDKIKGFAAGLPAGLLVGAGLAVWIVSAEGCRFHKDAQIAAHPVEAMPTERAVEIKAVPFDCPGSGALVVLQPAEKQADKIEQDYGLQNGSVARQDGSGTNEFRILGESDLPRLPWGGKALSALDDSGKSRLFVKPNPEPLIEIPARWEFYVEGAVSSDGKRYSVGAQYDALRFAHFHVEPFGAAGWRENTGSYAEAGVRVSLKP